MKYTMSTKELARLAILKGAIDGAYTVKQAALFISSAPASDISTVYYPLYTIRLLMGGGIWDIVDQAVT
ncbi:MAG: hypothetical protein LBL19_06870 [Spirochaetaceae bacterium]|nr:hypothetical protein [Spirochaetaceae bacterium]